MPDPIETRTPSQLARATAIPADALLTVQLPGDGAVVSIEVGQLLQGLTESGAAYELQTGLAADLAHAANTIGLVYGDPDPAKKGWYLKSGASGTGSWALFERLNIASAELAEDFAEQAASMVAVMSGYIARYGPGPDRVNLFRPQDAEIDKNLNTSGALVTAANFSVSGKIPLAVGQPYRLLRSVSYLAFYTAGDVKVGTVAAMKSDTEFTLPAEAGAGGYCRFSQTTATLTKPRQMLVPTSTSLVGQGYLAPAQEDTASTRRKAMDTTVLAVRALMPQGIQIFDKAAATAGQALNQSNGGGSANASYSLAARIPLDQAGTQVQSIDQVCGFYDADLTYLGAGTTGANTPFNAATLKSFTGSITGSTLTTSASIGLYVGMTIAGAGVRAGTTIASGSGTSWGLSETYDSPVASTAMTAGYPGAAWFRPQLLTSQIDSYKVGYGTAAPTSAVFGWPTQAVVDSTALTKGRASSRSTVADDANILNPARVITGKAQTPNSTIISDNSSYSVTGLLDVNPGDFVASSINSNAAAFFKADGSLRGFGPFAAAYTFTGSITDNVLTATTKPTQGFRVGHRITGSGATISNILRQLTTTEGDGSLGGTGTYLMNVRQAAPVGPITFTAQLNLDANVWNEVPAGGANGDAYFLQFHALTTGDDMRAQTVKQGRADRVNAATFTAQIAGDQMTVSAIATGRLVPGDIVTGVGVTTAKILSGPYSGRTGTYTLSLSQTVATDTVMYAGADPAVVPKAFGGSGGMAYPREGVRVGFFGNSQTNNGRFQATWLTACGGVQSFSNGYPGASFASLADTYTIPDLTSTDVLVVTEGANEWAAAARPLGTITDSAATNTVGGKMRKIVEAAYAQKRSIKIIFTGNPYRGYSESKNPDTTANGQGYTGADLDDFIRAFCKRFGLGFVDWRGKSGINDFTDMNDPGAGSIKTHTSDGLHFTTTCGQFLGRIGGEYTLGFA